MAQGESADAGHGDNLHPGSAVTAAAWGGVRGYPLGTGKAEGEKNPSWFSGVEPPLCFLQALPWGYGSAPASFLHINHFLWLPQHGRTCSRRYRPAARRSDPPDVGEQNCCAGGPAASGDGRWEGVLDNAGGPRWGYPTASLPFQAAAEPEDLCLKGSTHGPPPAREEQRWVLTRRKQPGNTGSSRRRLRGTPKPPCTVPAGGRGTP